MVVGKEELFLLVLAPAVNTRKDPVGDGERADLALGQDKVEYSDLAMIAHTYHSFVIDTHVDRDQGRALVANKQESPVLVVAARSPDCHYPRLFQMQAP